MIKYINMLIYPWIYPVNMMISDIFGRLRLYGWPAESPGCDMGACGACRACGSQCLVETLADSQFLSFFLILLYIYICTM
jgi:hypothetical protein